jgi:hypothetical protein
MWPCRVKIIIGTWLVISGFIPVLQSPINFLVVGFFTAICCFKSGKLWQATITGILGLWIFLCGLSYYIISSALHVVVPANFIIVGIAILVLGIWAMMKQSKKKEEKIV